MTTALATPACIAFEGAKRLAAGTLADVALAVRKRMPAANRKQILVFDFVTGQQLDLNLSGTDKEIRTRYAETPATALAAPEEPEPVGPRGPGRPKLGVVAREVTLLPRHWDWLNAQPGGASVALRKLVEEARRTRGRVDACAAPGSRLSLHVGDCGGPAQLRGSQPRVVRRRPCAFCRAYRFLACRRA